MKFRVYKEGWGSDAYDVERRDVVVDGPNGPKRLTVGPSTPGAAVLEYIDYNGGNADPSSVDDFTHSYIVVALDDDALALKPPHDEDGERYWVYGAKARIEWSAQEEKR